MMVSNPRIREHIYYHNDPASYIPFSFLFTHKKDALKIGETRNDLLLSLSIFSNITASFYMFRKTICVSLQIVEKNDLMIFYAQEINFVVADCI